MHDIATIRKDYQLRSLDESDVSADPLIQFRQWWTEAIDSNIEEVNAMTLATANENGKPSARIVLLKGFDEKGFIFFSNYDSNKASDLKKNPQACLVFYWKELERQVRICGVTSKISEADSTIYFQSRPHGSKISAWASAQSRMVKNRAALESNARKAESKFKGLDIICPPFWGGYIVQPASIEFWQGRANRLHDRILYTRNKNEWEITRLAP